MRRKFSTLKFFFLFLLHLVINVLFLFQYFKRDADELESWINEKLQAASDESYKDPTNLQVNLLNLLLITGVFIEETFWIT
jgi:hypothetical protein